MSSSWSLAAKSNSQPRYAPLSQQNCKNLHNKTQSIMFYSNKDANATKCCIKTGDWSLPHAHNYLVRFRFRLHSNNLKTQSNAETNIFTSNNALKMYITTPHYRSQDKQQEQSTIKVSSYWRLLLTVTTRRQLKAVLQQQWYIHTRLIQRFKRKKLFFNF
jgi:hypothetical protein